MDPFLNQKDSEGRAYWGFLIAICHKKLKDLSKNYDAQKGNDSKRGNSYTYTTNCTFFHSEFMVIMTAYSKTDNVSNNARKIRTMPKNII